MKRVWLDGYPLRSRGEYSRLNGRLCAGPTIPISALESRAKASSSASPSEARIRLLPGCGALALSFPGPFGIGRKSTERDPLDHAHLVARTLPCSTWPICLIASCASSGTMPRRRRSANISTASRASCERSSISYVSEGIGGGLFVDGQPVMGAFGNAGEIGRMLLVSPQRAKCHSDWRPSHLSTPCAARGRRPERRTRRFSMANSLFDVDDEILDNWLTRAAQCLRIAVANIENLKSTWRRSSSAGRCRSAIFARSSSACSRCSQRQPYGVTANWRDLIGKVPAEFRSSGGATLPLFSRLTTQPRAIRPSPKGKRLRRCTADDFGGKRRTRKWSGKDAR